MWWFKKKEDEKEKIFKELQDEIEVLNTEKNKLIKEKDNLAKKLGLYETAQPGQNDFDIEMVAPIGIERRFSYSKDYMTYETYLSGATTVFIMQDHSEFVLTTTLEDHEKYVKRFKDFIAMKYPEYKDES